MTSPRLVASAEIIRNHWNNFAYKLDVLVLINADDNIDELLLHLDNSVKIFDYTNSKVLSDYSAYNSF